MITRTARIWTRLYKEAVPDLKATAHRWLEKVLRQTETPPELPAKFEKRISRMMRSAYAYGYWLSHLYVEELKAARKGKKYQGKVTLSDIPSDDDLRRILEAFMNFEDVDVWEAVIPQEALDWLEGYVPSLAGNFSADILARAHEILQRSMAAGGTLKERMRELSEVLRLSNDRLETIARTEITRADTLGRLVSMKAHDDVIGVEFSAIMDDRTTEICSSRHGLIMRLDDPRLPENTPPLHVNCVLGDTLILPIGGVSAYSERVFNGDIIVMETSRGNDLTGTPNHPILTSRGWVPLCEIQEGDYVVCDAFTERGNIVDGENQQVVASIKDTVHAFFNDGEMFTAPVPMTAEDFHHDGRQSEVAVIYADGKLLDRMKSSSNKQVIKHKFIFRDVIRSILEYCESMLLFGFKGVRLSSFSFMSFLRKSYAFFRRCILHSYKLLFMPVAWLYSMSEENTLDGLRGCNVKSHSNAANTYTLIMQSDDSFMVNGVNGTFPLNAVFEENIIDGIKVGMIFFLKCAKSEARKVIFDKVVDVKRERFSGQVYNLQTETGIYVANNIITHNCRSLLLAATVYEYPDGLLTSHEYDEVPAGIQRPEDIEEVLKILT